MHFRCFSFLLNKNIKQLEETPNRVRRDKERFLQPGDILAIYIPSVLPADTSDPPVIQAGKNPPVMGYPVTVTEKSQIKVPYVDLISVEGKDLEQVRQILIDQYAEIITKGRSDILVQFLMRAGERVELRNVTGPSISTPEK